MAANTSLLQLQTEVGDRLNLDYTQSAYATRLTRWANLIQNDISSRYPWPWLLTNTFVQTVADYTTGTITGTAGSTALTGNATAWTSASPNQTNTYIQPANDTNWYQVKTVVSGTSITLANPLTAAVTAGTYTLRTTYYDLPANCLQVFDVRQTNTPAKLTCLGIYSLDLFQPDINTTSNPTGYFLFGEDPAIAVGTAKQYQIGFFPCPDAKYNIQIRYYQEMTDLSATTDLTIIPPEHIGVLLDGMEWLGSKYINDPEQAMNKQMYEASLANMIAKASQNGDYFPILQSSDNQINQNPFLNMPGSFPSTNSGDY